jgi:hypothetical protein
MLVAGRADLFESWVSRDQEIVAFGFVFRVIGVYEVHHVINELFSEVFFDKVIFKQARKTLLDEEIKTFFHILFRASVYAIVLFELFIDLGPQFFVAIFENSANSTIDDKTSFFGNFLFFRLNHVMINSCINKELLIFSKLIGNLCLNFWMKVLLKGIFDDINLVNFLFLTSLISLSMLVFEVILTLTFRNYIFSFFWFNFEIKFKRSIALLIIIEQVTHRIIS